MTDLWDDVPDVELPQWALRSKPRFPSEPIGGGTWHEYFQRYRASLQQDAKDEDEADYDITITEPAEEFDDPIRPLASFTKLAHANGWSIHTLAHARAFAKGKPFKSGANEGMVRPDQQIETQWLYAEKPGVGRISVAYEIVNGTPRGTGTTRRFNGNRYGDREFKAILKGEA